MAVFCLVIARFVPLAAPLSPTDDPLLRGVLAGAADIGAAWPTPPDPMPLPGGDIFFGWPCCTVAAIAFFTDRFGKFA